MESGKLINMKLLKKLITFLIVVTYLSGFLSIGLHQNAITSSVVYAEEKKEKEKKITISNHKNPNTTLTGYIVNTGRYSSSEFTTTIYTPKSLGDTAEVYYGVDNSNSTQGEVKAYISSKGWVRSIRALSFAGGKDVLLGVSKGKEVTLFKGSDGFYYTGSGGAKQAYYAWSSYYDDDGRIDISKTVTYFVKVKITKKDGKPSKAVKAKVVIKRNPKDIAPTELSTATYANVGDVPNTSTLLAEIFYTYGGTDGKAIKKAKINYSTIRLYPNPSSVHRNSNLYNKENPTISYYSGDSQIGAYIPNRLTMASSPTYQGNTLANMLLILGGWGYLSVDSSATRANATNNNDFNKVLANNWDLGTGWLQVSSNFLLTLISPILWLVALLADQVNAICIKIIDAILYSVELVGNPMAWLGIFGGYNPELEDNLFGDIFLGFREQILSNDNIKSFLDDFKGLILWSILITFVIVVTTIVVRLVFRRKNNLRIATTWIFRLTAWFPLLAIGFAFNGIGNNITSAINPSMTEISDTRLDMLKVMVATNGDLSKIYTDEGKIAQILGSNDIDLDNFSLSNDEIKAVNEYVSETLGSELDAALDIRSEVSTATFDVNDYIEAIKLAGNSKESLPGVPANQLPSNLSVRWSGNTISATGSPMLFVEGDADRQSANLLPNGYAWEGKVYIFTEANGAGAEKTEEDEEESIKRVSTRTLLGSDKIDKTYSISYNSSLWSATPVALEKPWTYLYGTDPNNNSVTENPETYYFGINSPLVGNLEKGYQASGSRDSDDTTKEPISGVEFSASDIISGVEKKEVKTKYYFKYANAYTLALINKYQGTNSLQNDSLQLSNQSVVFLLQSNLGETGLDFFATNTNHAKDSKGKSGAETSYRYKRMIRPQKVEWISSQQISGALQTFAFTMVIVAFIRRIATLSVGDYVLGRYSALSKTFINGSWSSAVYYNVLTFFWVLISQFVPKALETAIGMLTYMTSQTSKNETIGSFGALGIGISALMLAWVITKTFTTQSGLQFSIVSSIVDIIDSIRFGIKGILFGRYGLDTLIYGSTQGFGGFDNSRIKDIGNNSFTPVSNTFGGDEKIGHTKEEEDFDGQADGNDSDVKNPNAGDSDNSNADSLTDSIGNGDNDGKGFPLSRSSRHQNSVREKFRRSKNGLFGVASKLSPVAKVIGMGAMATAKGFNAYSRLTGISSLTQSAVNIGQKYMPSGMVVAGYYLMNKGGTMLTKGLKSTSKRLKQSFNTKPKRSGNDKFSDKSTLPVVPNGSNSPTDSPNNVPEKKGLFHKSRGKQVLAEIPQRDKSIKPTSLVGAVPEEQHLPSDSDLDAKAKKDKKKFTNTKPKTVFEERRNEHLKELSNLSPKEKTAQLRKPIREEREGVYSRPEKVDVKTESSNSRQFVKKRVDRTQPKKPMKKENAKMLKYKHTSVKSQGVKTDNIMKREEEI